MFVNESAPSWPALSTTNLFEKSSPPVSALIGGMMMSLTSELTMPPKAAPIITPTARSNAFPLIANSLKSFSIRNLIKLARDEIDKLFGYNDRLPDRLPRKRRLHFLVRACSRFHLGIRRIDRNTNPVADLPVDLEDDLHFVFHEKFLVVNRPGLPDDAAFRVVELVAEDLPKLGSQVRRERIQHEQESAE